MTQCSKCIKSNDCWIKRAKNFEIPIKYWDNEIDRKIVAKAGMGKCDSFFQRMSDKNVIIDKEQ